jgi:hypothetical protein
VVLISICCAGCAAIILKSVPDEPKVIQFGATKEEITKRFGQPFQSARLEPPTQLENLQVNYTSTITVLDSNGLAFSNAVFAFKGRLDSKARAGQAGFDSFMTMGLAEFYLIPKALWERTFDEDLQLTVWFNAAGLAVAYQWDQRKSN